jgi:hypothetical protein
VGPYLYKYLAFKVSIWLSKLKCVTDNIYFLSDKQHFMRLGLENLQALNTLVYLYKIVEHAKQFCNNDRKTILCQFFVGPTL